MQQEESVCGQAIDLGQPLPGQLFIKQGSWKKYFFKLKQLVFSF